ncbi:hypothetical protein [Bacteroides acidifaciens]|uniref:hypothetical protein n=1 Tax=Bacteroides acidifaciens TaxID=85831 RepID=UPI0026EC07B4|nr:hypothetical protein [Bacteroides acidifaciens]
MVTQDELFDDLLNFTKSVKNAKTDEESSQLLKNFQAAGLEGKIDYENGIRPFSAKDARQALSELKLDMIDYDKDNLVDIAKTDPVMFKLIYDNLCSAIADIDRKLYPNWWNDWFLAETETRALAYYDQYEQFRQESNGYGHGLNDFYSKHQYNSRMMVFSFTVKKRSVETEERQPVIKYLSFVELPPIWADENDEKKILSKNKFLYAYWQYDDEYDEYAYGYTYA